MKYPTKKQILELPRPKFKPGIIKAISDWKKEFYKEWNQKEKAGFGGTEHSLQELAILICTIYNVSDVEIILQGNETKYFPRKGMWMPEIWMKNSSIISFFHELAHHLFGKDELTACRWSVWLYQLRFRKDYENLIWNQHLLQKPTQPSLKSVTAKSQSKDPQVATTRSRAKAREDGK